MQVMGDKRVLVLGASGMLGNTLVRYLSEQKGFDVVGTVRSLEDEHFLKLQSATPLTKVTYTAFDATAVDGWETLLNLCRNRDFVINAIGMIKPMINDKDPLSIRKAIMVNSLFPPLLAEAAQTCGARVIQICTDCVFSGVTGFYREISRHDALDVYGKTKSLGEVCCPGTFNLRCSIVGREIPDGKRSLLEWFLSQSQKGRHLSPLAPVVFGFRNHLWNGLTAFHFAAICAGIMRQKKRDLPAILSECGVHHLIPADRVTKHELLCMFRRGFCVSANIEEHLAEVTRIMTLETDNLERNRRLWGWAGYSSVPTVEAMVEEMADWELSWDARLGR